MHANNELEFDITKLKSLIPEFLKTSPKTLIIPEWVGNFKTAIKELLPAKDKSDKGPATGGTSTTGGAALPATGGTSNTGGGALPLGPPLPPPNNIPNSEDDTTNNEDVQVATGTSNEIANPEVSGAATGAPDPGSNEALGNAIAEAITPPPLGKLLAVGDECMGFSTKFKADFNNMKCKITAVLTKHYKVDMLEGPSKGQNHKYLHDQETLITPAATGAGGEPTAPPSAPR